MKTKLADVDGTRGRPGRPAADEPARDSLDERADAARTVEWDWRNPPLGVRVALVGAVFAVPGTLAGLMANCLLRLEQSTLPATCAAVVFAVVAGWIEAAD